MTVLRDQPHTTEHAERYDQLTRTLFARIYPVIAKQILERTGIVRGTCVDIGSGPGPLTIALAHKSDLHIIALDRSQKMQLLLNKNVQTRDLGDRITPVLGDVHTIPFREGACDLVVSRGSYHFWSDLPVAFREIYRILKVGGSACIGGGYGSSEIRDAVMAQKKEMKYEHDNDSENPPGVRFRKYKPGEIETMLEAAGICGYRIINDESGFWMIFTR